MFPRGENFANAPLSGILLGLSREIVKYAFFLLVENIIYNRNMQRSFVRVQEKKLLKNIRPKCTSFKKYITSIYFKFSKKNDTPKILCQLLTK